MADPYVNRWLIKTTDAHGRSDGDVVRIRYTGYAELDNYAFAVHVLSTTVFALMTMEYAGDTSGVYPDAAFVVNATGALVTTGTERLAVNSVSGFASLLGLELTGVGDGGVITSLTVTSDTVTLDDYYSDIILGLPFSSIFEPMAVQMSNETGSALAQVSRIRGVDVRLMDTLGLKVTTDSLQYHEIVDIGVEADGGEINYSTVVFRNTSDAISEAPDLFTGTLSIPLEQHHSNNPRVIFKQDAPMPFNILGLTFKYEITEPSSGKAQQ
jgi:hypothetical protein